jgi:hypothetical protein
MRTLALVFLAVLAGSACTTLDQYHASRDPGWVAERTSVEKDDFKKLVTVVSPTVRGVMDGGQYDVFLRGWKDLKSRTRTTSDGFQIYVATVHGGRWHRYSSAWDSGGSQLETRSLGNDVDCSRYGCSYSEDIGIDVTRAYLEAHRGSGLSLKVSGSGGEAVVRVPAGYVAGFLARFDDKSPALR